MGEVAGCCCCGCGGLSCKGGGGGGGGGGEGAGPGGGGGVVRGFSGGAGTPAAAGVVLGETFHFEVFRHGEEGVEVFLSHIHLAVVHEIEDAHQVAVLDALHVEQRMFVPVPPENGPEEGGAGREDHFMRLDLVVVTGEGDVEKVFILAEFAEGAGDVRLEVVPTKTELLGRHLG